jgi:hypothetical protein
MIEMEFFQFSNKKEEDQIEGKGVLAFISFSERIVATSQLSPSVLWKHFASVHGSPACMVAGLSSASCILPPPHTKLGALRSHSWPSVSVLALGSGDVGQRTLGLLVTSSRISFNSRSHCHHRARSLLACE